MLSMGTAFWRVFRRVVGGESGNSGRNRRGGSGKCLSRVEAGLLMKIGGEMREGKW